MKKVDYLKLLISVKRLWWLGYKGKVCCFQWPTLVDPLFAGTDTPRNTTYDQSELRAWYSGQALNNLLTILNDRQSGKVRVIAHSMGNVVMGEALKLCSVPMVHSYIAAQAAISARAYDNTAMIEPSWTGTWITTPELLAHFPLGDSGSSYFSENHTKVPEGQMFNYFNLRDWALGWWVTGNRNKPNELGYHYSDMDGNINTYRPQELDPYSGDCFYQNNRVLTLPSDKFKIFARCVQSRSYALGALETVKGFLGVDLASTFHYDDQHYSHSKEFRSNVGAEKPFWSRVALDFKLSLATQK